MFLTLCICHQEVASVKCLLENYSCIERGLLVSSVLSSWWPQENQLILCGKVSVVDFFATFEVLQSLDDPAGLPVVVQVQHAQLLALKIDLYLVATLVAVGLITALMLAWFADLTAWLMQALSDQQILEIKHKFNKVLHYVILQPKLYCTHLSDTS